MSRQRITRQDIANDLADHPGSTVAQIMERTGGTRLSVEQHLFRLKTEGKAENRGETAGGSASKTARRLGLWYGKNPAPRVNSVFALGAAL